MTINVSFLEEKDAELLRSLGLSEGELAVYLALLELGQAHIQDISRKSCVTRASTYNHLAALKERQLVSETKKGKRHVYAAAHPSQLLQLERARIAAVEKLIPQLLAIDNSGQKKPKVTYHEGIAGMEEMYNVMLHDKQTIYAWEDLDRMFDIMPQSFTKNYPEERSAKKIPLRTITRDTPFARKFITEKNIGYSRESRLLAAEEFGTDIEIFGNKVALFSLRKDSPFGVLIEDPGLARTLKIIWQEQWDQLAPIAK
ncbi:MAG: helix-turn-helix domain-containing protein [Patescibacteria group bacterium]